MPDTNTQPQAAEDLTIEERIERMAERLREIKAIATTRPGEDPGMMAVRLARVESIAGRATEYAAPMAEMPEDEPAMSL